MKSFIATLFLLFTLASISFGATCAPQFQNGDIGDWDLALNIASINGSAFPAQPVADEPTFSFPQMPSGKPGLRVKPGKYWMKAQTYGSVTTPAHNEANMYVLTKALSGAGGTLTISGYCPRANYGFASIHFVDAKGDSRQAPGGTLWSTNWMTLNLVIPPGTMKVRLYISGDADRTGGPIMFDNVCITP
jgi:hypothetical protein